jgi:molybdopterin adenylyltransferase
LKRSIWYTTDCAFYLVLRESASLRATADKPLEGLPGGTPPVPGIFAAVPYCVDLIGGPYLETDAAVCKAFRPKSAQRPTPAAPT